MKNKKITVVGLGKSGFAAARFLAQKGAKVKATDASSVKEVLENAEFLKNLGVTVETGFHTPAFIENADLVVASPGVSKKSLPLALARERKIPVISEVELASFFCPGLIVGVTGSNGKTTTSHLIHEIILDASKSSVLCGNVGTSFVESLSKIEKETLVVLELSSFQLEDCRAFRPNIAVILNLSPNHLDRHQTMENYISAKERIFTNQGLGDYLILNFDDPILRGMAKKARSKVIFFSKNEADGLDLRDIPLRGQHNIENILAAAAVAAILKIPKESIQKTIRSFKTLEHRLEPLGALNGVEFINDSKSTTVASTQAAVSACKQPVILVAGGRDKGSDFTQIDELLEKTVKLAVLYGESSEKMAGAWKKFRRVRIHERFDDAIRTAFESADSGDTLLLSPMCASFDQFSCFEERGERFKNIFKELRGLPVWNR